MSTRKNRKNADTETRRLIAEAGLSDADTAALADVAALETAEADGTLPIVEPAAPEAVAEAVADTAATILDPDPEPVAPPAVVAVAAVAAVLACRAYTMAEGAVALTMARIMSAIATVKTGAAGWWYMHAKDGQFGNGGTRYSHRYAILDGLSELLPDGTRTVLGIRFVGLVYDVDGTLEE